jgi:hypothetical protein
MSLKTKKRGGCSSYADVNASYSLDTQISKGGSLKRRGGCSTPAGVNDSYMLNDLLKTPPTSTGGSLRRRGGNCLKPADVNSSYMLDTPKTTTGGYRRVRKGGSDLASQTASLISQTQALLSTKGGCGCNSVGGNKGGSVELAPFAAAVTLLAARYFTDEQLMKGNPFTNFASSSSTKRNRRTRA